jgi:hypothetical protein
MDKGKENGQVEICIQCIGNFDEAPKMESSSSFPSISSLSEFFFPS